MELDYDLLIQPQMQEELMKLTDYVPLCILPYVPRYFTRATEKAKQEHYQARTNLQCTSDPEKFMESEMEAWLKKHPEFKNIVLRE